MNTALTIDTERHCRFSKRSEKTVQSMIISDYGETEGQKIWDKTCRIYESYLVDLPYTGAGENPMWEDLYDSILVFAWYEAMPEPKIALDEMERRLCKLFTKATFPSWLKPGKRAIHCFFSIARGPMFKKINAHKEAGDWDNTWGVASGTAEVPDGEQMVLVGCPIAEFATKHGLQKLMPALCNVDFSSIGAMNIHLVRPKTVSMGYPICDYRIVPKDSDYARKYPVVRRADGFLVNGPDD